MSIRTKLALILFVVVGAFLALDLLLLQAGSARSFAALERSRSETQINGILRAFDATYDELAALARSPISDVDAEAPSGPSIQAAFDLALTINKEGRVLDYSFKAQNGTASILREVPNQAIGLAHPFMKSWRTGTPPRGLFETTSGLMVIGSAVDGRNGQPALSIRGRWLGDKALGTVHALAGSTFTCLSIPEFEETRGHQRVPSDGETTIVEKSNETLIASTLIQDVRGLPVAVIESPVLRNELGALEAMQRQEILTALFVAILFPLVLLVLIQVVVTGPLGRLSEHAQAIGEADDASRRLNLSRTDEIGALASEFDRMLDRLESSRRAQRNAARISGRSAVATTVMHGVGNLVNSVNVSAQIATDSVTQLSLSDLRAIEDALRKNAGSLDSYLSSDPQGTHLLEFLSASIDSLEGGVTKANSELSSMVRSVDEVKNLVHSLEQEENHDAVDELIQVDDEVRDALERSRLSDPKSGVVCHLSLDSSLETKLDPHRLGEIVDALLQNAEEALASVKPGLREVRVRLAPADGVMRLSVEDNGEGIEPERQADLFAMNTTTRGEGRGRGLHMASLAAQALGGELTVWSGGPGQGAIFTLEVPLSARTAAA